MHKIGIFLLAWACFCYGQNPCTQSGVVFCNGFEGTDAELKSAWGGSVGSNCVIFSDPAGDSVFIRHPVME